MGFAAETDDLVRNAQAKLASKNLDLIVANDVSAEGVGFASETNAGVLLRRDGSRLEVPLGSKRQLAERILDEVRALRSAAAQVRRDERGQGRAASVTRSSRSSRRTRVSSARSSTIGVRWPAAAPVRAPEASAAGRRAPAPTQRGSGADPAGRRADARGHPRDDRRLPALPARTGAQDDRLRPGKPERRADVRRRGAGRRRGRAGPRLRRPRRPAAHGHHREGPAARAQGRLHRERAEVPPAPEPQPGAGRDRRLPAVPRGADPGHPAARAGRPRQVRRAVAAEDGRADHAGCAAGSASTRASP